MNTKLYNLALILILKHHIKLEKTYLSVITWTKESEMLQLIGNDFIISEQYYSNTGNQYIIRIK